MKQAIIDGYAGVLVDDGTIGKLLSGADGAEYWESKNTACTGSFAVNPAVSRFLLAGAKRKDGSFVVDSLSTDGGCYPRNVIVENGLLLIKFGALSLNEFAVKSSLNGPERLVFRQRGIYPLVRTRIFLFWTMPMKKPLPLLSAEKLSCLTVSC